jgi:hypothetical protein
MFFNAFYDYGVFVRPLAHSKFVIPFVLRLWRKTRIWEVYEMEQTDFLEKVGKELSAQELAVARALVYIGDQAVEPPIRAVGGLSGDITVTP